MKSAGRIQCDQPHISSHDKLPDDIIESPEPRMKRLFQTIGISTVSILR